MKTINLMKLVGSFLLTIVLNTSLMAQKNTLKGFVIDKESGTELPYCTIQIPELSTGSYSDESGFFLISDLPSGNITVVIKLLGYKDFSEVLNLTKKGISTKNFYLEPNAEELNTVNVSGTKQRQKTKVLISQNTIKPKELKIIPSVGGTPDLIQYLQVMPGVVFSGDQGGQLYIRGGSPVMNKMLLDGMTIYNPFHSIGLFSVFDADIISSVDVFSAGFGAEYGGRISAIVDVKTREGNFKKKAGKIDISPFMSKILVEGPLKKYQEGKGTSSYLLSYKNSYLKQSAPVLYPYINNGVLPFTFSDLFGKFALKAPNGSYLNLFGFNYIDNVAYPNTTTYKWVTNGFGSQFLFVPTGNNTVIQGTFAYSDYLMRQIESDNRPRQSGVSGFNMAFQLKKFLPKELEFKYGVEINGFRTNFEIYNTVNRKVSQYENTSELAAFAAMNKVFNNRFVMDGGLRIQRYATNGFTSLEPRLRAKLNISQKLRFKTAAGVYSQNLMSAVSDRDVVNLFYGFLSGPSTLQSEFKGEPVKNNLQRAKHIVAGFEFDLLDAMDVNIEAYLKDFDQITNANRDKIFDNNAANSSRPDYLKQDFIIEDGTAKGFDITLKYEKKKQYVWLVYAYNIVDRFDGIRKYQPHFDRRHNINLVYSLMFGKNDAWSSSIRWNYGSGFPFTQTQGFYELVDFNQAESTTDYTTANGSLGILYANLNQGRLPQYHRLDASLTREIRIKKNKQSKEHNLMEIIFSATNIYNRENIFYFDRVSYKRVNQLPLLPSIAITYRL